jgi:transcription elongation GreA/GreB family factor
LERIGALIGNKEEKSTRAFFKLLWRCFALLDVFRIGFNVNKATILEAITDALRDEFDTLHSTSQKTRAAGNDAESKAEGKYDTRSTEDNYLADGLARQARGAAQAGAAYQDFTPPPLGPDSRIDLGALVQLAFPDETRWFFVGPAGGGIEVICDGMPITVLTPESPLGRQLIGMKAGDSTTSPKAEVRSVE